MPLISEHTTSLNCITALFIHVESFREMVPDRL